MSDQRPATVTGERPDPDPLYVSEERRRETERAERNVWLGLATLVIIAAVLGAVALWFVASRTTAVPTSTAPPSSGASRAIRLEDRAPHPAAAMTLEAARAVKVPFAYRAASPPADGLGVRDGAVAGSLTGYATWYDAPPGTAAAGPLLRDWLGDWRGKLVVICAERCITTRLTDACACPDRNGKPTLIDLSQSDFARLAPPSQGVVLVTIGRATLPATDTE